MIYNSFESLEKGISKTEMPALVQCQKGTSVLYKGRYLYSKYDPEKSIQNIISNLTINPETLVLVMSPVLFLGYDELIKKTPANSKIVYFEFEKELFDFSQNIINEKYKDKIILYSKKDKTKFINYVNETPFRKVIRIDFSGGTVFNKDEYDEIFYLSQSVIDQFWKNRLTLIQFGRLFSKNIFKNLHYLPDSIPFESLYKTVTKPILVLGAGESLDNTIKSLKEKTENCGQYADSGKTLRDIFFILCVDAAINPLLENDIVPDAIVAVESQSVIEKAYIGKPVLSKIPLFCDLVGRSTIADIIKGPVSFFISEYSNLKFLKVLSDNKILPPVIKPLGSVGLVASEIALRLRKNDGVKIIFSGLDFSFTPGITHARQTPAHKRQLINNRRLNSIFNFHASFSTGTSSFISKNNRKMITSKALLNYALLFTELFSSQKNFFDAGESGINLNADKIKISEVNDRGTDAEFTDRLNSQKNTFLRDKLSQYINSEINALNGLKDILSYGEESEFRDKTLSLDGQIDRLTDTRDYLYIHFADAQKNTNRQSFLNRIKIESDIFLKQLETARQLLDAQSL
ncbi:MAG: motility associated factor glycosyltransferase family protein [Treponema sp.]|uniref:6-hydroxymethylpterin diphosphokinase MptE-like protein n=1 Tax=Treponema sp. TaxID=166 RepID=UPI00298E18C0|nr:6-hydroxymethylpterin diphosphokinase MptE-like protein [Treponema sp.]MBR5932613.1 motility associated factor glycosyltransferase family protein [Treponema sp.]